LCIIVNNVMATCVHVLFKDDADLVEVYLWLIATITPETIVSMTMTISKP